MSDMPYITDSHPEAHKPLTAAEAARLEDFYAQQHSTEGTLQEEFDKKQKEIYDSLEDDIDDPKIDNPTHYQSFNSQINIDCITAMRAAFGDEEVAVFCKLNAFKYNWRAQSKGENVDIGKAIWYLNKYLELNKG